MKQLPPNPLSKTRWESHVDATKIYQKSVFYDALTDLSEITSNPISRSKAESLAKELKGFKFLVAFLFGTRFLFVLMM